MKNEILKLIENNAPLTSLDISKALGLDEKEVISALAELEADRVICGYNTIINWDKVSDESVHALIEVRVTPQRVTGFDKIAEKICKFQEVDSVYLISGDYDFLVQIKGKSMKEISAFVFNKLSTLDDILSTSTHFVLKKYKDHGVVLEGENTKDERMIVSP